MLLLYVYAQTEFILSLLTTFGFVNKNVKK